MSENVKNVETKDKIKLPAQPLTRNQKWNVVVRIAPWFIIIAFGLVYFGTQVGSMWERNHTSEIQSAKDSVVQELKESKDLQ